MYSQKEQIVLEAWKTHIEKIMMQLPSEATLENHRFYLGGVIDSLLDFGLIEENIRELLYEEYAM